MIATHDFPQKVGQAGLAQKAEKRTLMTGVGQEQMEAWARNPRTGNCGRVRSVVKAWPASLCVRLVERFI
jgi:hypothetical protein